MKSLFEDQALTKLVNRTNKLSIESQAQWGKMDVSKMLYHCCKVFEMASAERAEPRLFIGRLLAPIFKSIFYNDKPFGKGAPTGKFSLTSDPQDILAQRDKLLKWVDLFHKEGVVISKNALHPFFGTFTPAQWGIGMYKHLDHHLRQFGV